MRVVVLGSATPSLESYYNANKNKYSLLELPDRVEQRPLPEVELIDMKQEFQETGQEQVVSRKLAEEIRERLERKEQVMILLNRRGYSPRGAVPRLRQDPRMQELRHRHDAPQACPQDGVPLLRLHRARARRNAPTAAASTCISWVRVQRNWKSSCTGCFRRRASAGLIAIRCAASEILSAP